MSELKLDDVHRTYVPQKPKGKTKHIVVTKCSKCPYHTAHSSKENETICSHPEHNSLKIKICEPELIRGDCPLPSINDTDHSSLSFGKIQEKDQLERKVEKCVEAFKYLYSLYKPAEFGQSTAANISIQMLNELGAECEDDISFNKREDTNK